jgi:hypothetical protein
MVLRTGSNYRCHTQDAAPPSTSPL